MTLDIENESEYTFDFDIESLIEQLLNQSLDILQCPYEVECNVLITSNQEMQHINHEQREVDAVTDVLSFPMIDFPSPCAYEFLEEENGFCFSPESGELMLGDIVISYERVLSQAIDYGHTIRREFSFLVVHSILHLFGYDHMEEEERTIMEQRQVEILESLQITRD